MCVADIVSICILGLDSVYDIRRREICLLPTILSIAAGIFYKLTAGQAHIVSISGALLPGAGLLLLSLALRGQIGAGDGLAVLALGSWESTETTWGAVLAGFFAAAAAAGIVFLFRRGKKEIPFIPFLLFGEVAAVILREVFW